MGGITKQSGLIVAIAVAAAAGCTPSQYAKQADKSAYAMVATNQAAALGESKPFDVIYRPFCPEADQADAAIRIGDKLVPVGDGEPVVLTLAECLEIAARNSRRLQNRKEGLYGLALDLANTRRGWNVPLLAGDLDADAEFVRMHNTGETKSASAEITPSITQRFINGGVLTLAATLDWATDFIFGSQSNMVGSMIEANFTQPILRGAWRGFAYEDQYRLARDFLFAVFDYERFTQTFAANIFRRHYDVLRQRDQLEKERLSVERQRATLSMTRVQVEGGLLTKVDEDRAEQALLSAQVRYERNQQDYENALDAFKLLLGLPIRAKMELDYPFALVTLAQAGPKPISFQEDQAIAIALMARPDVLTERAKLRDADRNVEIAADQFLPQLDVELGISATGTEPRNFERIRFNRHTRFARMTFNYDLDQTDNRDAYRLSVMSYDRAKRDLELFLDQVRLEVRAAYRELLQSRETYELQDRSVVINSRRHKLAQLQQKEGQLSPTDVLDAEEDLRSAENGRTAALVAYTNTRVEFLASLGMIEVDERGMLHERTEPFKFDRISEWYGYVRNE